MVFACEDEENASPSLWLSQCPSNILVGQSGLKKEGDNNDYPLSFQMICLQYIPMINENFVGVRK